MSTSTAEMPGRYLAPAEEPADVPEDIAAFCARIFGSMSRSDQRRWGEIYVRGLVTIPGRKTIQKIADLIAGTTADQSLQQFVNQSPWEWEPVRAMLAELLCATLPVRAWLLDEVAFPKTGRDSVGVTSQYAPSDDRRMNCQLAVALSLAGAGFACPVNWRLILPRCWDDDPARRRKAHLPAAVRHRPSWQHLLEVIDETRAGWGIAPRTLVLDRRHDPAAEMLLRGLDERGLGYVVRIAADTPTGIPAGPGRWVPAGELFRRAAHHRVMLAAAVPSGSRTVAAQFVSVPVPDRLPGDPGRGPRPGRHLVVRRLRGRELPGGLWVTNLGPGRLSDVAQLTSLPGQARADAPALEHGAGLRHFEGRSYRGWHHHVTLASVAHAYRTISTASRPDAEA